MIKTGDYVRIKEEAWNIARSKYRMANENPSPLKISNSNEWTGSYSIKLENNRLGWAESELIKCCELCRKNNV